MSLWNRLTGEFIDVIDWTETDRSQIVWRFERYGAAIKYGAKLTVRESQVALFVHEGRLADVFGPGLYMLETNNLPILTTLQHWDHGFNSPFKSEIYFVSTRRFQDLKWGTKNPILLRDAEFGMVRLRAFGTYAMRVSDPSKFLTEVVGTDGEVTTDEVMNTLRNLIVTRFSIKLAASGIPALDLAGATDQLADLLRQRIAPELAAFGVELPELY
ncbi:MAG: SPFH domain-containing protein, partial [Rubrimonas sp.]